MKLVALLPFKNESWCIPSYLHTVTQIVDEIIAIDDGSIDDSASILKSAGAKVFSSDKLRMYNSGWSEGSIRSELLRLGRESKATHFLCLDSDETLSVPFLKNYKKLIGILKPGQKLSMQWLALWKSYTHYRNDNTVWSNNWKDFIVMDDGVIQYNSAQHMHVGRTPGTNEGTLINIPNHFGSVLHFQFSAFNNFQLKQCWLRCSDLIQRPYDAALINQQYSITMLDYDVGLTEMPKDWYEEIPFPKVCNFDPNWDTSTFVRKDLLPCIIKYFEDYGVEFFEDLDIWHIPQLREIFMKKIGREPK